MSVIHPSLALPLPLLTGIPSSSAHTLSFLFTSSYVGCLYLAQTFSSHRTRKKESPSPSTGGPTVDSLNPIIASTSVSGDDDTKPERGSRDHPETIRSRMKAVGLATTASLIGVWWVVKDAEGCTGVEAVKPTLRLLGIPIALTPPSMHSILPYILAPTLFLGPLFATYLDRTFQIRSNSPKSIRGRISNIGLIEIRNYLVGPLTEELVFRSTILSISLLGRFSIRSLIFGTPFWFGLAHAHHALEVYRKAGGGRDAAVQAIGGCLFQLMYTTLFGWFASYLFLRTGSIIPPLISHMFCNFMGIYLPTTAIRRHPRRKALIWTTYILGIVGFGLGLRTL